MPQPIRDSDSCSRMAFGVPLPGVAVVSQILYNRSGISEAVAESERSTAGCR